VLAGYAEPAAADNLVDSVGFAIGDIDDVSVLSELARVRDFAAYYG